MAGEFAGELEAPGTDMAGELEGAGARSATAKIAFDFEGGPTFVSTIRPVANNLSIAVWKPKRFTPSAFECFENSFGA